MASVEETVSTQRAFQGQDFSVRVDHVLLADGTVAMREVVEHPNDVVILAIDDDGRTLLVRQYRKASKHELLELPAGGVGSNEAPATAAQRELREETGYFALRMQELGYFFAAPGIITGCLYVFLATGLRESPLPPDNDEHIHLERIPFDEVLHMGRSGELHDAKTLAALLLAEPFVKP